jgi:hypothetical protein
MQQHMKRNCNEQYQAVRGAIFIGVQLRVKTICLLMHAVSFMAALRVSEYARQYKDKPE